MINSKKKGFTNVKGFTIVELVIVIAVIAVLSAVLIPTFSSLVKKANLSADTQAVRQMNTILATEQCETITEAIQLLSENDLDIEDYKPITKDHYFYFVNGKVIFTDANNTLIYPNNNDVDINGQWMSLSGIVPMSNEYEVIDGSVTIENGSELVHLMEQVKNDYLTVSSITLSGNINLLGAAVDFGVISHNFTIKGENNAVLSGIRVDDNALTPTTGEFAGHSYGFGLFAKINTGATVTIENINISNLFSGSTIESHEDGANTVGLIAGYVNSGAKLIIKNVNFNDCEVHGWQKAGALVGQLSGNLELEKVNFTNTIVIGATEIAKLVGVINNKDYTPTLKATNCTFDDITVIGLRPLTYKRKDITADNTAFVGANEDEFYISFAYQDSHGALLMGHITQNWAWVHILGTFNTNGSSGRYATMNNKEYQLNGHTATINSNYGIE